MDLENNDKDFNILFFSKLLKKHPLLIFYFCIHILSFTGLPFFLGFFIKFFIFYIVISDNLSILYFFISLSFIFSFFYGIRILRLIIFDYIYGSFKIKKKGQEKKSLHINYSLFFLYLLVVLSFLQLFGFLILFVF